MLKKSNIFYNKAFLAGNEYPAENFNSRACHKNTIVLLAPVEFQLSTGQMCCYNPLTAVCQDGSNTAGTGACPAGLCDSAASFPGPHREFIMAIYPDEVNISAVWKNRVVFNRWSQFFKLNTVDIVTKEY